MARLKILATTFALLFFTATAASDRTAVKMEEEIINPGQSSERCRRQIQSEHQLNACHQYLREGSQSTMGDNRLNQSGWREQFPRCCDQLEQLDEECRCEGIKRIVQQQRQRGELEGQEMQEMVRTAESLPLLCRVEPRRCDVRAALF